MVYHRLFIGRKDEDAAAGWRPFDPTDEKDKKSLDGINTFAYAFGLLGKGDLGKSNVKIPFHQIEGAQAVVRVQQDDDWKDDEGKEHKGGFKILWNNDAWPVSHERVRDVPKDPEALLAMGGIDGGASGGGGAPAVDDFSDI